MTVTSSRCEQHGLMVHDEVMLNLFRLQLLQNLLLLLLRQSADQPVLADIMEMVLLLLIQSVR